MDFPIPEDLSKLRNFLGLINQLASFIPNLAGVTNLLCTLLKKDAAFIWLDEHTAAFNKTKSILTNTLELHHFDTSMPTYLVSDASRLNGIGFVLIQSCQGPMCPEKLIQHGSHCLSSCEKNYATIELECLAMAWALQMCDFFLRDMPQFSIVTDNQPLVGIFQKPLGEIANPRICRIHKKMLPYNFQVKWLEGKSNAIANALSWNLIDDKEKPLHIRKYIVASSELVDELKSEAVACTLYLSIF